jgi:hypothetical protein
MRDCLPNPGALAAALVACGVGGVRLLGGGALCRTR